MTQRAAEAFGQVERELQQERAAALGRIGRTLETLLATLQHLERQASAPTAEARTALVAEHTETRKRAVMYRWYLEVQREAVGLRRHQALDEMYRIPPPLR